MKRMIGFGLSISLVLAALAGCADTSSNVIIGETVEAGLAKTIVVNNKSFSKGVELTDLIARKVNDLLQVQVVLTSLKQDTIRFEHSFEWFDADGFKVKTPKEHWKPEVIYGKQVLRVEGIAPNEKAESFKFMVREPTEPTPW